MYVRQLFNFIVELKPENVQKIITKALVLYPETSWMPPTGYERNNAIPYGFNSA